MPTNDSILGVLCLIDSILSGVLPTTDFINTDVIPTSNYPHDSMTMRFDENQKSLSSGKY